MQVWESPPAITDPGHDPALLAEQRVLDAAAALAVVRDALRLRPPLQARLQLGRPRVLRRHEVVGDHHDPRRIEDALGAHLLHRAERDRAGDVVRHHDVAADGDDVARPDVVGVGVGEQDLLSERVRQRALQRLQALVERHDVAVLQVDVVERRVVGRGVAVADRLARHHRPVAVLQHVDGGRPDAAGGRRARHDDAVAPVRGEQARERRAEERGREQLVQHRLVRTRRDPLVDLDPAASPPRA